VKITLRLGYLSKIPEVVPLLVFEALIFLVVILLLSGNSSQANSTALLAFYALAAAVATVIGSTITREIRRAQATKTN
jgi:hypothetical protein